MSAETVSQGIYRNCILLIDSSYYYLLKQSRDTSDLSTTALSGQEVCTLIQNKSVNFENTNPCSIDSGQEDYQNLVVKESGEGSRLGHFDKGEEVCIESKAEEEKKRITSPSR